MKRFRYLAFSILLLIVANPSYTQQTDPASIDEKVQSFLNSRYGQWRDMNIPYKDGKILFDLIITNKYTSALEIGTSTGHSTIWMAWALSKTGGKLITIEIDESRYREAVKNFETVGLSHIIDARLANAHDLVPELKGPFDFVFSDADKSYYKNYFLAIDPKLKVNGCYTSHNVSNLSGRGWSSGYLDFLKQLPNYVTTVDDSGAGMAISYKRSE